MDAQGIQLRPAADSPADPAPEVERLESLLAGRRAELSALQEEFRESKGLVDDGGAGLQEEFRERPR